MGKMKERLYTEDPSLEQSIGVGDSVYLYDSKYMEPQLGQVLYSKIVGQDEILDLELANGALVQVYGIQCKKAHKKLARLLWVQIDESGDVVATSASKPESGSWLKFREILKEDS